MAKVDQFSTVVDKEFKKLLIKNISQFSLQDFQQIILEDILKIKDRYRI